MKVDKFDTVEFMPGEYILREGARCDSLFIVKSGQIEIFRIDTRKNKIPLGIVDSGEYLGEMSLIADRSHSANAVAITKTICLKLTSDSMEKQLKLAPPWLVSLTRGLALKLYQTNEVLKRNSIVDESLSTAIKAIQDNELKKKVS